MSNQDLQRTEMLKKLSSKDKANSFYIPEIKNILKGRLPTEERYVLGEALNNQSSLIIIEWRDQADQFCQIEVTVFSNQSATVKIGMEDRVPLSSNEGNFAKELEDIFIKAIDENRCNYTPVDTISW